MILLKFIGYVILFMLVVSLIFRIFGKAIMRWIVRRMVKRAENNMRKQSEQFFGHQQGRARYGEEVYNKGEVHVYRKGEDRKIRDHIDSSKADDVDFEELD